MILSNNPKARNMTSSIASTASMFVLRIAEVELTVKSAKTIIRIQ